MNAGERLVALAGNSGTAATLLSLIGSGATTGAALAKYSGLPIGTAAEHLLFDAADKDADPFDAPYQAFVTRTKAAEVEAWRKQVDGDLRDIPQINGSGEDGAPLPSAVIRVGATASIPAVSPALDGGIQIAVSGRRVVAKHRDGSPADLDAMIEETGGAMLALLIEMLD